MNVLIVESNLSLGHLWSRHLERLGYQVSIAVGQHDAIEILQKQKIDIIVLDIFLQDGVAFAVSDFANYRLPNIKVIFVTNTTFFSDGSIFQHAPNACAYLRTETPPDDLAAMVAHYGVAR